MCQGWIKKIIYICEFAYESSAPICVLKNGEIVKKMISSFEIRIRQKKKLKKNLPHPDLEGAPVDTNFGVTKFMILFIPYFNKWYG
jgi:hypothetical protein